MTLPSSGALSLSQLKTEFSGNSTISLSEYYKSGGNGFVPSTVPDAVVAASFGGSNSAQPGERYTSPAPQINTFGRLYTQTLWGDNNDTILVDRNFTVDKTGTYQYYAGYYVDNGFRSGTISLYVNGSLVRTHSFPNTYKNTSYPVIGQPGNPSNEVNTLSVSAGQVIRIVCNCATGDWCYAQVNVGGSSYDNSSVSLAVNENVPSSGVIKVTDFYGGRGT